MEDLGRLLGLGIYGDNRMQHVLMNQQTQQNNLQNLLSNQSYLDAQQSEQYQNSYNLLFRPLLYQYHDPELDILSPEYIRKEWDTEFCKIMGWTLRQFYYILDHILDAQASNSNDSLSSTSSDSDTFIVHDYKGNPIRFTSV